MRARKCTVRAVRAGASSGWSHFDALQRRHVRARGRLRHISKAPVSADTLYRRKCFRRFPGGLNRPRAAAGIRRGVCRKPASYFMNFDLLRILEPSKKAGLRIPAHFLENAGSPVSIYITILQGTPPGAPSARRAACPAAQRRPAGFGGASGAFWMLWAAPATVPRPLPRLLTGRLRERPACRG